MAADAAKLKGVKRWTIALAAMCSVFLILQLSYNVSDEVSKRYKAITFTRPLFKGTKLPENGVEKVKEEQQQQEKGTIDVKPNDDDDREQKKIQQPTTESLTEEKVTKQRPKAKPTTSTTPTKEEALGYNHFPAIDGMYHMDKHLHLPPPVPIRPNSKEPVLDYNQRRDYPALLSQPAKCGLGKTVAADMTLENFDFKNDVFLLMVVKSSCAMAERRKAVRTTWGNETWVRENLGVEMRIVFLLGRCTSPGMTEKVNEESKNNGDLLQWDFHDSFRNLTLKEVLFLQWFTQSCRNVPFVFKGDDDVYVNTKNLIVYLLEELRPDKRYELFVGSRLEGSPRILDPTWKYYVSYNLYPDKYYPPYVSGGGFLMSGALTVRLFQASLHLRIFPIDDAFVGTLLKYSGVDPKNDRRFKSWGIKQPTACHLSKVFTFHKSIPITLLKQWKDVTRLDERTCDNRYNVLSSQTNR